MKPFTKQEILGVLLILLVVGAITGSGLVTSLTRARDAQRMSDLGAIANALEQFYEEYGFFPPAENGKIKACKGDTFDEVITKLSEKKDFDQALFFSGLRTCEWGKDSLSDLVDEKRNPYIATIPQDPKTSEGYSYLYISNTKRYQLYTHFEGGVKEDLYSEEVASRELSCGKNICHTGKSFGQTPLGISIEDYEQQLLEEAGKK